MNILTKNGYFINKKNLENNLEKTIKNELTGYPLNNYIYQDEKNIKKYKLFIENREYICVPKYYGLKKIGQPSKIIEFSGLNNDMNFLSKLKDYQIPCVEKIIKTCKEKGGGLLCVPCGFGKTVVALYIACALKSKTLVIVHKEFLLNQWKERIEQFTDAKIGIIQGKNIDIEGKDIVIGMIQSISQSKYDKKIFNEFNFAIYDECHHTSAETFCKALKIVNTKYQLGLSATPTRKDGLTKVFKWYLGDIIYQVKRNNDIKLKVNRYLFNSKTIFYKEIYNCANKVCIASMINKITEFEIRNNFIINIIKKIINKDRNILILSERRNHLIELKELIKNDLDIESGLYIGGMKSPDLDLSCEKQIILATYQMASEGFDCKKLNTLILATSKGDIVQSIGRILRKKHELQPMIIDICDMFSIFKNQSYKRLKYYKKCEYDIETLKVTEGKIHEKIIKDDQKTKEENNDKFDENECIL